MGNILLLEPASLTKRRLVAESFSTLKKASEPSLVDITKRLREVRDYSVAHRDALIKEAVATLQACSGVKVVISTDTGQAVSRIREISGDSPIAINKSAVIMRELMGPLVTAGFSIIESYYDEFKSFEGRFNEYWQLPKMNADSLSHSFENPIDLSTLRNRNTGSNGSRDFVGLLGVNAISATDGSVVMFQHMSNIGKIVEQAKEIILVASLDKIVKNLDDAIFQTKCMALFGSEALPLSLHVNTSRKESIDDMPFLKSKDTTKEIHLILFDNGRSNILQSEYKDILACIGCRACLKDCPASKFFDKKVRLSPKEYLHSFLVGTSNSLKRCLQCKNCEADCPLHIDVSGMILQARTKQSGCRPLSDHLLSKAELLEKTGSSLSWLAGRVSDNKILRWLGEKMVGISKERPVPKMQHTTFTRWFETANEKGGGKHETN